MSYEADDDYYCCHDCASGCGCTDLLNLLTTTDSFADDFADQMLDEAS